VTIYVQRYSHTSWARGEVWPKKMGLW